jgi:HSP20 family protein
MNKVYDEFLSSKSLGNFIKGTKGYPRLDIYTRDDKWCIDLACPGVKEEDLTIELIPDNETNGRFLKITGRKSTENTDKNNYLVKELTSSSFERIIRLPENISSDPLATMKDGILSLVWNYPIVREQKKTISIAKG